MVKFEMVDGGDSVETNFKCWAIGATVEHLRFCQVRTFGVRAFAQGGEIRSARMNSGSKPSTSSSWPPSKSVLRTSGTSTALIIYAYIDFFAPLMISLEQRERPASHCLTEVCQLNIILETRMEVGTAEATQVHLVLAMPGRPEEVHLLGPLLISESPSHAASDAEGFLMLLFVIWPGQSGLGPPLFFYCHHFRGTSYGIQPFWVSWNGFSTWI